MAPHEPIVRASTPLPRGYTFIRRGNTYITKTARRLTHASNSPVYIVHEPHPRKHVAGIRVPTRIYHRVLALHAQTKASRAAKVARTDACLRGKVEGEIRRQFPGMPEGDVQRVLGHALRKGSERVGRTGGLEVSERVGLAVRAYVRHVWTGYEGMLRGGMGREEARRAVYSVVNEKLTAWGGEVSDRGFRQGRGKGKGKGKRVKKRSGDSSRRTPTRRRVVAVDGKGSAADPIALADDSEEELTEEETGDESTGEDEWEGDESGDGSSQEEVSEIDISSDEDDLA